MNMAGMGLCVERKARPCGPAASSIAASMLTPKSIARLRRSGLIWIATVALLCPLASAAVAADSTCDALTAQYEARHATLEAPQVSAALFSAAENGCDTLTARLLDAGASTAARDRTGGTALTHAARAGHDKVVELLLGHGADIDERTVEGATPLYAAAEKDRLKAARALVAHGANVSLPGRAGVPPLSAAAYNGDLAMVNLLLDHGADPATPDASGKVAVLYAAARGFVPVVTRLLATGVGVNAVYANKLTLLMWAAGYANDVPVDDGVKLVSLLLDKGATIDAKDDRGRTPLMIAAELGHDEVVDLLLQRGAARDAHDGAGKTAADLAPSEELKAKLAAR
ncbi:ankyrin repeat domain-containing protein [Lichenifustis flavocetrariae]|uniref:Ankyrin repeat domain-containing protein n=1 Tax=Lichenifustis flavocetrariae TaxID=2949735 RepID=A0AA42CKT8_9HYPH|nr:ankyrin repeat domain-containing protein [Lichenifustis flavocetrariae]MCW6506635.1 ankyrin repeat domain-containing protein [Lichenifustis flavocetrariae]